MENILDYNTLLSRSLELFPYDEPNEQQIQIMRRAAQLNKTNEILMINSATGSGKTAASLTALMARRTEKQKIVVFTRTVSQMEPILREWARIVGGYDAVKNRDTPLIMPLLGKPRLCKILPRLKEKGGFPNSGVNLLCKANPCVYYPGIFGKIENSKAIPLLYKINFTVAGQGIRKTPSLNKIFSIYDGQTNCGYYEQRTMLQHATIVVATYPYFKEPLFSSLLNSMGSKLSETLFMIDEAHNLEKTMTLELLESDIKYAARLLGERDLFKKMLGVMKTNRKYDPWYFGGDESWDNIRTTITEMDKNARIENNISFRELVRPEILNLLSFIMARDTGFIVSKKDRLQIMQATPKKILRVFTRAAFTIFQSGTFEPLHDFKNMFGLPANLLETKSSEKSNKFGCYLKAEGLTSMYSRRKPKLYRKMVETIIDLYNLSPRHILLICPSYVFQEEIYNGLKVYEEDEWLGELPVVNGVSQTRLVRETKNMDTDNLVNLLGTVDKKIIVAVSNGKLSEGIEVVHKKQSLISMTVFAGLPYIPPQKDNIIMKRARASAAGNPNAAKAFEQNIPLFMAVKQAFGRTTRARHDRGAMVILDFRAQNYLHKALGLLRYTTKRYMYDKLENFFEGYPKLAEV